MALLNHQAVKYCPSARQLRVFPVTSSVGIQCFELKGIDAREMVNAVVNTWPIEITR